MSTPLSKSNPIWLATQNEDDVENPHYKRSIRYYKRLYLAWPDWADVGAMAEIYRECKRLRTLGRDYMVDHIVPISHPYVCGLHNEFNLQILTSTENLSKSNHWWPDMWGEQLGLSISLFETEQVREEGHPQKEIRGLYDQTEVPRLRKRHAKTCVREGTEANPQKTLPL